MGVRRTSRKPSRSIMGSRPTGKKKPRRKDAERKKKKKKEEEKKKEKGTGNRGDVDLFGSPPSSGSRRAKGRKGLRRENGSREKAKKRKFRRRLFETIKPRIGPQQGKL